MNKIKLLLLLVAAIVLGGCQNSTNTEEKMSNISEKTVQQTVEAIMEEQPEADRTLVEKGVAQAAALWESEDGSEQAFKDFAKENYLSDPEARKTLFDKLSTAFEIFFTAPPTR